MYNKTNFRTSYKGTTLERKVVKMQKKQWFEQQIQEVADTLEVNLESGLTTRTNYRKKGKIWF